MQPIGRVRKRQRFLDLLNVGKEGRGQTEWGFDSCEVSADPVNLSQLNSGEMGFMIVFNLSFVTLCCVWCIAAQSVSAANQAYVAVQFHVMIFNAINVQ